jgi:AcrR family transcriptional regulator
MARPKSDEKRSAILEAATRVIVAQGLSAPTAGIAKKAGVANGSLFTYFETKTDLFNQLYLELKAGMASAAMKDLPEGAELREQFFHIWWNWMNWARAYPEKRRALAQLAVSDEITPATRIAAHKTMARITELMERSRANGPMRRAPMGCCRAHELGGGGDDGFHDSRFDQCKEALQSWLRRPVADVVLILP